VAKKLTNVIEVAKVSNSPVVVRDLRNHIRVFFEIFLARREIASIESYTRGGDERSAARSVYPKSQ
jgi:hypothetical protein